MEQTTFAPTMTTTNGMAVMLTPNQDGALFLDEQGNVLQEELQQDQEGAWYFLHNCNVFHLTPVVLLIDGNECRLADFIAANTDEGVWTIDPKEMKDIMSLKVGEETNISVHFGYTNVKRIS